MVNLKKWMEKVGISVDSLINGKVNKSGDIMSGSLSISFPDVDSSKIDNAVTQRTYKAINLRDKNNTDIGFFRIRVDPSDASYNGSIVAQMIARNFKSNGSEVYNSIQVIAEKDGTRSYSISDPANFRDAIGLTNKTVTLSGTATTGTFTSGNAVVNGKVAQIEIKGKSPSTATAAGLNMFEGTISGLSLAQGTRLFNFYDSALAIGSLSTAGVLTVRIIGGSYPANTNFTIYGTAIIS